MLILPVAARGADAVKPLVAVPKSASAVFSPDNRVLMTVGEESRQCHFWSLETGEEVNRFGDAPRFAVFSADGRRVLVVGRDHAVRVFDAKSGKALRRVAEDVKAVGAAAINPDGSSVFVAPAGAPFDPAMYDVGTGKALATLKGHDGPVTAMACEGDMGGLVTAQGVAPAAAAGAAGEKPREPGAVAAEAGHDGDSRPVVRTRAHGPAPFVPALRVAGRTPEAAPGVVRVYSSVADGMRVEREIKTKFVPIVVGQSPDATVVWAASADAFGAWDVKTGEPVNAATHAGPITPAGRLTADRKVGVRPGLGSAALVDAGTGAEVRALAGPIEGTVACHAFSPDSKRVALATSKAALFNRRAGDVEPGAVYVFDVASGKQLARFSGHAKPIVQVGVSPGGSHVFSRDAGGTLMVWRVP
ncbi:MAG TPA: hypothetical protein VEA69_23840 [Tepidisphaeraceae bacterium]|nr:hypothetical protein [Tepidisphaeraceae bacterium]